MKKLKLFFACLLMAVLSIGQMWATDPVSTLTFTAQAGGKGTADDGVKWTVTSDGTESSYDATKGIHFGTSSAQVTYIQLATSEISGTITKVVVNASTASGVTASASVTVGGSAFGGDAKSLSTSATNYTFEGSASGEIIVRVAKPSKAAKAIYVKSVAVTYTSGGGGADPVDPTITFEDGSVDVGYTLDLSTLFTSNSNGDVTYSITSGGTYATIEGSVLTGVAAGSVAVQASQEATASYNAATANSTITVNEHVVTAGTYSITFNNAFFGTTGLNGSLSGANLKTHSGTQNDITVEYQKGTGSNMYLKDSEIRLYNGNKLVVTAPTGFNITTITGLKSTMSANVGAIESTTWSGKANTVTLSHGSSSGNSALTTISVTYEAIAPEVTVDPSSLEFEAKQNIAVGGKTFTLTGANLTSGLTLVASTGFSVSPTSLTAEAAMAQGGAEVTVTPATPTATTTPVEGTVTISGGGLASNVEVALSMAVTPTYAVAIAVNDGAMGSATINGGTATVYAEYADDVNLVAAPESGYEFVNWSASDDDIEIADASSATTTATIGAAGTITATFQAQACTGLAAPTLDEVTTTYQSATIAWNAVDNADGYVLNIVKHEGGVAVLTDEVIVAPVVSFEKTGLDANTQYDYTVMAVGDGTSYCDESNPTLAGSFTTSDYPAATLSLVENGGTPYNWGSDLKLNSVIALPEELAGLGCTGKVLVGWTNDEDFADTDDDPTGEDYYWAKGADYTITSTADVLYAVLATEVSAGGYTKVTAVSQLEAGDKVVITNGTDRGMKAYESGNNCKEAEITIVNNAISSLGEACELTVGGSENAWTFFDGTYYIYAAGTATSGSNHMKGKATSDNACLWTITISNGETTIQSNNNDKTPYMRYNSSSKLFSCYNSSTGQAGVTLYRKGEASYSGYTTECEAQLPKLDAPVFGGIEEGVYFEAQDNITLSAADGATIYFVIDEEEITEQNRSEYTVGAISLSDYGVHTVKAIAVQAGHEDSEVAEATYAIGKEFASVSDLYSYLEANSLTSLNNVKVTGVVSRITFPWDETKITYYISDNGQIENDLQMFKGAGTGADVLAVGDQVTVTGNYTLFNNTTHEFGAGNTIVARTAAAVASVAIGGAAEKTTYSTEDNQFSHTGLTATATYNTGYTKDVTALATWTNNLENNTVAASGNVEVTATYEGESDTKEVAVTYTSKTLEHITLSYSSTTAYVGMALPTPTVTASYVEDIDDEDVTALVAAANGFDTESAYNGSAAGPYTINVSYTLGEVTKSAEYTVTVKAIYNNESEPYTVTEALDLIGARFNTNTASADSIVVAGIVSRLDGTYVNTYWISDDGNSNNELEVYSGKYLNKVAFTAANQLHVGDVVVVKGKVKTYQSTKEFDSNSRLISVLREPEFAIANIVAADEFEANFSDDMTVVPTANSGDVEFTLTSGNEAVVTIVENKLHAVAEGDAVITAIRAATNNANALNYKEKSITFNVHVIAKRTRYTVTFDANGGEGTDPEAIANQLAGATVDMPAACLYNYAGHGFTGWKVINLSTEAEIEVVNDQFEMPESNVKIQAQWAEVATCAISFEIGGHEVATADAPQEADYNIAQVGVDVPGFTFLGWSETEYADEVETAPTLINVYHAQAGEESKVLYGIYSRLDEGTNYGKYERATAVAEGNYLIVCESQSVAFDGSLTTLDAANNNQAVTISDGVLELANADNYVFTIAEITGGYSILAASGKYIGHGLDANGLTASASALVNTISITDGNADIVGAGGAYLRYNATSGQERFRYFKSNSYTNQKAIQLYKKNVGATVYTSSPVEVLPSKVIEEKGGLFSIGEGKKVRFSRGNLRYSYGRDKWYCAENQLDVLAEANLNFGKEGYTGSIDLFGWSNAVSDYGRLLSNKDADYPGYDDFKDWGNLFASDANKWSTLSKDEWNYLQAHNNWTILALLPEENSEDTLCVMALFPENWQAQAPSELANLRYKFAKVDLEEENLRSYNTFTFAQWESLFEANGAVALPTAGARAGYWGNMIGDGVNTATWGLEPNGQNYDHVDNVGWVGYYWLSTQDTRANYQHCASFVILPGMYEEPQGSDEWHYTNPAVWSREKRRGNSVRLVTRLYNVIYDANGGTGEEPVVDTENYRPGEKVTVEANTLTKEGYDFQGWLYGKKLYQAGDKFTMNNDAVTLVAQWKKNNISTEKMMLISDANGLSNGMAIALGCSYVKNEVNKFEMAGDITGTNKYMNSVSGDNITLNNGLATFTEDVITMIAEQVEGGWKLRKDETHYLTLTGTDVKWDTQANATAWTISFSNGNVEIASGNNKMQFNSQSPRFKTYTSNQTAIMLFGKATVVTENANVSDLGYVEEGQNIVASGDITLTIDVPTEAQSITAKNGATVEIKEETELNNLTVEAGGTVSGDEKLTVKDLIIKTTLSTITSADKEDDMASLSGQIALSNDDIEAHGDVFIEITLTQLDVTSGWYAFSVPFPVSAANGIYYGNRKLTRETEYAIMTYHEELRAAGQYAWKKYYDIMRPGQLYIIAVGDTDYKTLLFKKEANEDIVASNEVSVSKTPASGQGQSGWNGLGNPNQQIAQMGGDLQFLDHENNCFHVRLGTETSLSVGSAFMYQYTGSGESIVIEVSTALSAPAREPQAIEKATFRVKLINEATGKAEDIVYLRTSEEATNTYEIGRDLGKMSMGTAKCAQMSIPAYGTQLCIADFPLVNNQVAYPLSINTPKAGTYSLVAPNAENADIYLTYEDAIIWNLSESAYTIDLTKGVTTGYGLLLKAKMPQTPTGIENGGMLNGANGVQKVIIDENVFIIRGGKMYDVTGKAVR